MQAPKFSPGEPAIIQSVDSPELNGLRVIVLECLGLLFNSAKDEIMNAYRTLPAPKDATGWWECALRPLPPEELAGCFDANEVPRKDEVSA